MSGSDTAGLRQVTSTLPVMLRGEGKGRLELRLWAGGSTLAPCKPPSPSHHPAPQLFPALPVWYCPVSK